MLTPKVPEGARKGQCGWCNLFYDYNQWRQDRRVRAKRKEIAAISTENVVREIRPPSIDPYSLCPCGSGKKVKFCDRLAHAKNS